jgi:hypothetical protein
MAEANKAFAHYRWEGQVRSAIRKFALGAKCEGRRQSANGKLLGVCRFVWSLPFAFEV